MKKKKRIILLIVGFFFLLLVSFYFFDKQKKEKESRRAREIENFLITEGRILYENGEMQKLEKILLEKLSSNQNNVDLLIALGNVYAQQSVFKYNQKEAAVRARVYLEKALEINPAKAEGVSILGYTYEIEGNFDRAIEYYNLAINLEPENSRHYSQLGHVLEMKGDYEGAIEKYNRAIKLDPKDAFVYSNLAKIFGKAGQIYLAQENYQKALSFSTNKEQLSGIYASLGSIYSSLERTGANKKQTLDYLEKALEANPNNSFAYSCLGEEYFLRLGEKEEAENFFDNLEKIESYYQKAFEINKNESNIYRWYGMTQIILGDMVSAEKIFENGLMAADNDARLFGREKIDQKARFYLGRGIIFAQEPQEEENLKKAINNIGLALDSNSNLLADFIQPELSKTDGGFFSEIKNEEDFKKLLEEFIFKLKK